MRNRFGTLLRLARRTAKKTLQQVADNIGVSPSYLSKIERGLCAPPREHLVVSVAEFLGIEPEVLVRNCVLQREQMAILKPQTVEAYAFLLRRLNSLEDDELGEITAILRRSAGAEQTHQATLELSNSAATLPMQWTRGGGHGGPQQEFLDRARNGDVGHANGRGAGQDRVRRIRATRS